MHAVTIVGFDYFDTISEDSIGVGVDGFIG